MNSSGRREALVPDPALILVLWWWSHVNFRQFMRSENELLCKQGKFQVRKDCSRVPGFDPEHFYSRISTNKSHNTLFTKN